MFIQVKNVACPFRILQVFEFFLTILETSLWFLLLAKTLRPLDAFWLLIICAKMLTSLGKLILLQIKFCANHWHFNIKLSMFFFSGLRAFALVLLYNAFPIILFLFCSFSVLFLCICTDGVFYLWLCTGFIICTCVVTPTL